MNILSNRAARRRAARTGDEPALAAPQAPTFHLHASTAGGGNVLLSVNAARILLDVCNLSAVGEHLQTSQSKLAVGFAQQELEAALVASQNQKPAEPPETPADDDQRPAEPAALG